MTDEQGLFAAQNNKNICIMNMKVTIKLLSVTKVDFPMWVPMMHWRWRVFTKKMTNERVACQSV